MVPMRRDRGGNGVRWLRRDHCQLPSSHPVALVVDWIKKDVLPRSGASRQRPQAPGLWLFTSQQGQG